jgi:hypothetical protein
MGITLFYEEVLIDKQLSATRASHGLEKLHDLRRHVLILPDRKYGLHER